MSHLQAEVLAASDPVADLIERGQASERAGQREAARQAYEAAIRHLSGPGQASVAVDLFRWIGRTYFADGDLEAAVDCAELSRAAAEANRNTAGIAQALILLGTAAHQRGQLDDAIAHYLEARAYGLAAEDPRMVALMDMNLGAAASVRGDHTGSLEYYRESLTGFRLAGASDYVAYVLNNLGMLYTDQERWEEADQAFTDALEICTRTGDLSIQAVVEVNRAELLIGRGAYDDSLAACDSARAVMERAGDARPLGELQKFYGIIYRQKRDYARAEECLGEAARIAAERQDLLLIGEVARERAELYRMQQRHGETLRELNVAHRSFEKLHARRDLSDIHGRLASLEEEFLEIVRAWGESIESADQYTQGHCRRVAEYACLLARAAGVDEQSLLWFRMGGLLHDVGKIVVPIDILNKPGKLDPAERAVIERHPEAGVDLLAEVEFPWDIRPMVRHHHEQWGGGGYPDGLKGEEIPLSARILCIADVFDALTSDRPYRAAHSQKRAMEIMRSMVSHFDPSLLPLWEALYRSGALVDVAREEAPAFGRRPGPAPAGGESERGVSLSSTGASALVVARRHEDAAWIGAALARAGTTHYQIACGDSLDAALDRLVTQRFDVVLLHFAGDDRPGIGTLARVNEWAPESPVVIVADRDDEALALRAIREGAEDWLCRWEVDGARISRSIGYAIERHRLRIEERARSLMDDLTALHNRRGFFGIARHQWLMAGRQKRQMVLFFVDLDDLKTINDRYGHAEGDAALIETAGLLRDTFRRTDVLGRIGGDEFGILGVDASDAYAETMLSRLWSRLEEHNAASHRPYALSLSIGAAVFHPGSSVSLEDLVSRADMAMYEDKRRRRQLSAGLLAG